MGRRKPIVLNTISFDTQTQAFQFFQNILQEYVPGERISAAHHIVIDDLFKNHPNYTDKVGPGVAYFEVMPEIFGSQCFCAVLIDGQKEGFSYKKCVTGKG